MSEVEEKRLYNLLRHIDNVRDDCLLLGQRLIERGQEELGVRLIANGQVHDNSKFRGIEWEYLNDGCWPRQAGPDENGLSLAMFHQALHQHVTTNWHHPECWTGGIEDMDFLHLAEMVADWHARSSEQGTDLLEWVKERATERFGFSTSGRVYKDIKKIIELLLEPKFV